MLVVDAALMPLQLLAITYIFEEHLKKLNPNSAQITYDIANLFDFIDNLPDLSLLVLNPRQAMYTPHDKGNLDKFPHF